MQIVHCQNAVCGKAVTVKDELVGRKVMCPHCRTPMIAAVVGSTAVQAIPAAKPVQPEHKNGDDAAPRTSERGDADRYVAVLSIPYGPNIPVLMTGLACMLFGLLTLFSWQQRAVSLYQRFLTIITLTFGAFVMAVFFVHLFNRRTLVLDRKAMKLCKGNRVDGRIPYDNIALVEIIKTESEGGEAARAIKVQLREPDDPDSDWPTLGKDDRHILIDEGFKRPLGEICDLIQERSPNLIAVRPRGKRKRLGPKSDRPKRWSSGMVALAIIGPIAAVLLVLSVFFVGVALITTLLSVLLLVASFIMVLLLVHKKSGQYDLSETLKNYGPLTLFVGFGRQFYWAQRLPRVFVPWLILEGLGLMLLLFASSLLGPHARFPPAAQAVSNDAAVAQALAHLDDANPHFWFVAANELARTQPIEAQRTNVTRKLIARIEHANVIAPGRLIEALAVWGTAADVPVFVRVLDNHKDRLARAAALEAVGKFKDKRAAAAVVRCLGDFREAEKAIVEMGPVVEQELALLLSHKEPALRQAALRLLTRIGSPAILPTLQAYADGDDASVRGGARQAVRVISSRHNLPVAEPEPKIFP